MSKRRIRFTKTDMAKYISHLDLLRCFTRAIGRAELPAVFTQGFNPHMKMTFALPLPVGVTSLCESVDIDFEDTVADEEIMSALNNNLPPDIRVTKVGDPKDKAADIVCAKYTVVLNNIRKEEKKSDLAADLKEFFALSEVAVMKKTKKKTEKLINIMEYIRSFEICEISEENAKLCLVLDAGGEKNMKPDIVIGAFCERYPYIKTENADIERTDIFCRDGESLEDNKNGDKSNRKKHEVVHLFE